MTENETTETLRAETVAERERLAQLLAALTSEQWAAPSLCEGWRVREVVAHVTMPYRLTDPAEFERGMAAHGFDFNAYADAEARETTGRLSDDELLALYRDNTGSPWLPPDGAQAGALSHEVIHGLDITEALGLPAAPAPRIAIVLANAGAKNLAYFGTDLSGVSLVATDAEVAVGDGAPRHAPAKEILLGITGRRPLPA